jgi:hypothetical protein
MEKSAPSDNAGLNLGRALAKCKLGCAAQLPLLGVKTTWRGLVGMSANDPKPTFNLARQSVAQCRVLTRFNEAMG